MALWIEYPAQRDKIKKGFKPVMRDHGPGVGWTCVRDGLIGYGATAREAWHDMWSVWFTLKKG